MNTLSLTPKTGTCTSTRLGVARNYEEIEPDEEGVIRSQVLPGFQFRREDLLREPLLAELARDDVYADYVIPELQVAETRAKKAEERADAAAQPRRRRSGRPTGRRRRVAGIESRSDSSTPKAPLNVDRVSMGYAHLCGCSSILG